MEGHAFDVLHAIGEEACGEFVGLVLDALDAEEGVRRQVGRAGFGMKERMAELVGAGEALPLVAHVWIDMDDVDSVAVLVNPMRKGGAS